MSDRNTSAGAGAVASGSGPWRCACGFANTGTLRCVSCGAWASEWPLAPGESASGTIAATEYAPVVAAPRRGVPGGVKVAAVMSVLGVALVVAAGSWLLLRGGPSWPHSWDPRVAPIAAFDEAHRGLRFEHPVPVVFLSDAAFRTKVAGSGTTAKDRAQVQRIVEELRALGLTSGNPELLSGARNLVGSDVEGYYDFKAKKVWVRGEAMTPHLRVVLAHELTHVLQDQHFGVHHPKGDDVDAAYTSLIEADAVRMQNLYLKSLSPADQRAYQQADNATGVVVGKAANAVPAAIVEGQQFPYQIGPQFIDTVIAAKGTGGLDDAMRTPPTSTLQIIEPSRYLAGDQPRVVDPPGLAAGERRLEVPSTLGAFELFEVLSDRLDVGQAWKAARTWTGDSSVVYTAGGHTCVRVDIAVFLDTQPLVDALGSWVRSSHYGRVSQVNGNVRLDACDPGPKAAAPPQASVGPLDALDIRGQLASGVSQSTKLPPDAIDCIGDILLEVAGGHGLQQIVTLATSGDTARLATFSQALGLLARPAIQAQCPSLGR
jgi:hypothetical protein